MSTRPWATPSFTFAILLLGLSVTLAGDLALQSTPWVPGQVATITTSGGVKGDPYALLFAYSPGPTVLPSGAVVGVGPDLQVLTARRFDRDGIQQFDLMVPSDPALQELTGYLQSVSGSSGPAAQRDVLGSPSLSTSNVIAVSMGANDPNPLGGDLPDLADPEGPSDRSPLAINLGPAAFWSSQQAFVDVFRLSNSFQASTGTLTLGPNGYPAFLDPGQQARASMCKGIDGKYPGGQYVCLYEGSGSLAFAGDATVASAGPGRIVLDVSPTDGGIVLMLTDTDASDPVSNIRVVMPGFEAVYEDQPFHPSFLASLQGYRGLRFMDWMDTNFSAQQSWTDRPRPDSQTQGEVGVCVEFMVDLANTLGTDAWFCMPHLADDNYVVQFATYVRDNLDPSLLAHVEYTNEAWNGTFSQTSYCQQMGLALGLDAKAGPAGLKYYSQRSVEIFGLWEGVFGDSSRLVRVLASQSASPSTGVTILDWQNASQSADCLAIAPYFGGPLGSSPMADQLLTATVDDVLDLCESDIQRVAGDMLANAANAAQRGLELVAYEGGQHLVGRGSWKSDATLNDLFDEANRSPRMGQLYDLYLKAWMAQGGHLFTLYDDIHEYGSNGRWGLLEYQGQDPSTAPKWVAVQDFLSTTPQWW